MELKKLRISDKKIEVLNKMGIKDSMDLLTYYPFRYEEHTFTPLDSWEKDMNVSFEAVIASFPIVKRFGGNRSMTRFKAVVNEIELSIIIFNRPWVSNFQVGKSITIFGKFDGNSSVTVKQYNFKPLEDQLGIEAIYNLKDGVSQSDLNRYIHKALDVHLNEIEDFVPAKYREKYKLIPRRDAIYYIHNPASENALTQSLRHLKYEEFLRFQLAMQYTHETEKKEVLGGGKVFDMSDLVRLEKTLSFDLTPDQKECIDAILHDLRADSVMYRMLQGDVGSGKTLVAAFAMYATTLAHKQAALLVPTEILVKQHYETLKSIFDGFDIRIDLLYSSMPNTEKKDVLERLANNQIDIIVGTHSLFQDDVTFFDLGFVVADEQHRFGVKQRKAMLAKGDKVDFLLMSATPIPRTLAISLFGDMDVSTIRTLPKGKKDIITKLYRTSSMGVVLSDILELVDEGNQCYVVCPAIELNEDMPLKNVIDIYNGMEKTLGKKYKIGLLHGKMSSEEKDEVMNRFVNREYDFLVSTTVIEVGVNVPSANIMVIYDAHRFGMAQIHQLRGRVGRSKQQGYCYLLSPTKDEDSWNRLKIVASTSDGFELSRQDLMLRGPGDVLGERQSGVPGFVLGDVIQDSKMLELSRDDAIEILKNIDDPQNIAAKTFLERVEASKYMD